MGWAFFLAELNTCRFHLLTNSAALSPGLTSSCPYAISLKPDSCARAGGQREVDGSGWGEDAGGVALLQQTNLSIITEIIWLSELNGWKI